MENYFLALVSALFCSAAFLFILLPLLKKLKAGQEILQYVTEHSGKRGTPTMGGIAFIAAIIVIGLIFIGQNASLARFCLFIIAAYAITGALDDIIKLRFKRNLGLKAYQKIIMQLAVAVAVAFFVFNNPLVGSGITLPFSHRELDFGVFVIPLVAFIFLACTNGVNLTDGLDGLAASTTACYMLFMSALLAIEAYKLSESGQTLLAQEYTGLLLLCGIILGSQLAFLLFNAFPAKVFMGDVGSLGLGGAVACVSIFSKMSLYIPILGIIYVVSCLSVMLQVAYFKSSGGKRIFLMAPFHHHLQHKGLSETRIGTIYTVLTALCGCVLVFFALRS